MHIVATGAHLTYPHANGFHDDRLVLARYEPGVGATGLVSVRRREEERGPGGGGGLDEWPVATIAPRRDGVVRPAYPDVARGTGRTVWIWDDVLYIADRPGSVERVYQAPPGSALQDLCSVTADGGQVAMTLETGDERTCLRLDLATGALTEVFTMSWFANHVHHCPYDESWLAFSHEGPARDTPDRMWAWHDDTARCVLDQAAISDTTGAFVAVGHERWLFHDLGAAVIGYGESAAGPRGLYFVHPDDRPPVLVGAGDRFWHCDVSRDGRWAAVDTTGPSDLPGRGWQDAGGVSDVLLIDVASGDRVRLARTPASSHPYHPHPVFSPEGDVVLFNSTEPDGAVAVTAVRNPLCTSTT
ncbi:hypothetical protein [Streptosporangium amethystogenes]|uniref:hypothetical protein n=1 Tax=Streptosporangium amethystogenes TaxID=2002 RepID=UPI00068AC200|nr:hypothetical protein [Streptosporangium amethystogenes]